MELKILKIVSILNLANSALVVFYYMYMGVTQMNDSVIIGALIGAAGTIVATLIANIVARSIEMSKLKNQVQTLTDKLGFGSGEQSMAHRIGVSDMSITSQLGVKNKSLTEQIGVGIDDKSLSLQHGDIMLQLSKQTDAIGTITAKLRDEEIRRSALNLQQQNISDVFNTLLFDWKECHRKLAESEARNAEQAARIIELEAENSTLKRELTEATEDSMEM